MMWANIHKDDYGWTGRLRIVQDRVAQNISTYTTRQFIFRKPDGTTVTKSATFATDGADGVLQYTVENGLIDSAGIWHVQARISKAGSALTSESVPFTVTARLD